MYTYRSAAILFDCPAIRQGSSGIHVASSILQRFPPSPPLSLSTCGPHGCWGYCG
jgi:hypothetical protein